MMRMLWIVWIVLSGPLPPTGGEAQRPSIECWSDGRADVLILVDYCPPTPPPLEEMTLWLSWYDPAECYDENGRVIENINCDEDPTVLAGGTAVADHLYGEVVACAADWPLGETAVTVPGIGSWLCLDRGGDIRPTYREIYHPERGFVTMWVLPIDVLHHADDPPWWQFLPIAPEDWNLSHE